MISIIIPVYNQADKLTKCLRSLLRQTYRPWQLIIVDDGSIDNPQAAAEAVLAGQNIDWRFIKQSNQGAPAARNRGADLATGDLLLFSDADIIWLPEALAQMFAALSAQPQAAYAYGSFYWGRKFFKVGEFDAQKLRQGPFIHTSALLRRQYFPGFDESLKRFQDWDLWLSILERGGEGVWTKTVVGRIAQGGTMSGWLPAAAYRWLPWLPAVRRYQQAKALVQSKHGL